MIFDWDEFRKLANELRERDTEASQRTAVSRVYYAVYWKARMFLEDEGFIFRQNDSSHRQIWEEYKNKGLTFRAISVSGSALHQNRVKADYFAEIKDLDTLLKESFKLAENVFSYLQQIEKKTEN
jgi:uncharacterized protein (UPF0332 family)